MSRAHVRRTIHDKRVSFRLRRGNGGGSLGREGADDLTNCSRNESREVPCVASYSHRVFLLLS